MTTKNIFDGWEKIRDDAYKLARVGLIRKYLNAHSNYFSEKDRKYLEKINKINKTAILLKEFRSICERRYLSRFELDGYARKIMENNFENGLAERVNPHYILSELERISDDYHDSKIEELKARKSEVKIELNEMFKNARAKNAV